MYLHLYILTSYIGTPIQNNVPELFSLLNFMHEKEFSDKDGFLVKYGEISTEEQVMMMT
jgi:SNF2 family DNA or RNA helicase